MDESENQSTQPAKSTSESKSPRQLGSVLAVVAIVLSLIAVGLALAAYNQAGEESDVQTETEAVEQLEAEQPIENTEPVDDVEPTEDSATPEEAPEGEVDLVDLDEPVEN